MNEEMNNEKEINNKIKHKISLIPFIAILWLCVIVFAFAMYEMSHNKKDEKYTINEKAVYEATIDTYGDEITAVIEEYMKNNNGKVPTWEDIEDNVFTLKNKVSCEVKINYDGSVYLENCTVNDIKYTSKYTYGKKLEEPVKSKKELYIYTNSNEYFSITNNKYSDEFFKLVDTYSCSTDNCRGYTISQSTKAAIIFDDNKYYLYNYNSGKKEDLNLDNEEYNNIDFISSKTKDYGFYIFKNNVSYAAIYNLDTKKLVTDYSYGYVSTYNIDELLENGYFAASTFNEDIKKYTLCIININNGSVYKTLDDISSLESIKIDDKVIYLSSSPAVTYDKKIYNSAFESFTGKDVKYYNAINSDNTITLADIKDDTVFYVYNNNGELLSTSKKYKQVVKVVKDYVAVLDDDNNLKLIDKDDNEVATFLKVEEKHRLHPFISGWYTENDKNGIYMVVEDKTIPYGTEGSGLEYYYIPTTKETGVIKTEGVGGYAKPVMYFYPTKKTKINVTFTKPEILTTTYPKYKNNWTFTAYPNGDLYDSNNKYYYGMYWEELGSSKIDFSEGFYVTKENAIDFLEETTKKIGFTRREANEFIMYWLKILENNEKNLVYYELTESRNNYNNVIITPTPDSILRVAIHVKKVDKYTEIKEQKLPTFKRIGFTVVEWGGVEH